MYKYIIENDVVKCVEERVAKTIKTVDFIEAIQNTGVVFSDFLPKNCVLFNKNGDKGYYCVELPASIVPLKYKHRNEAKETIYNIGIPFTQFWFVFSSLSNKLIKEVYATATKSPFTSWDVQLYISPLLNIYSDGSVCTGDITMDMSSGVNNAINSFSSLFFEAVSNNDLSPKCPNVLADGYCENRFKGYLGLWQEKTKSNRFFLLEDSVAMHKFNIDLIKEANRE